MRREAGRGAPWWKETVGDRGNLSGLWLIILWTAATFLLAGTASAHKVNVFAYVEGRTVYVESYFPDGSPVAEAAVVVFGTHGKTVAEGKTDNQGLFQFDAPGTACDLTIEVNASMGHKATYTLKKEDWSK